MPFCSKCGKKVEDSVNFCDNCGNILKSEESKNQASNASFDAFKNGRGIIKIAGIVLCVLFFVLPLVQCSNDSRLNATGWEIATGTGQVEKSHSNPLVFALIIIPVALAIAAFANKSFEVLRNVSRAGLAAKIIFMIGAYIYFNSGNFKGAFGLTPYNWLVLAIYIWLVYYCSKRAEQKIAITIKKAIAPVEMGSFTDPRDGKTYKTVKIGEQIWMAENLAYECEGSKCYGNDPANCQKPLRMTGKQQKKRVPLAGICQAMMNGRY